MNKWVGQIRVYSYRSYLGQSLFQKVTEFLLSEGFFKPMKFYVRYFQETIDSAILLGDKVFVSSILTSRRCRRPCRGDLCRYCI